MTRSIVEIGLDQIKNVLVDKVFLTSPKSRFSFLPSDFYAWAIDSALSIKNEGIEHWDLFETNNVDFGEIEFKKLMFGDIKYWPDTSVYFVSDESLMQNIGYAFSVVDFDSFVDFHESKYQMNFFQPLDYILIFEEYRRVTIIHHEGRLITIG